jgi:hypothetical protein
MNATLSDRRHPFFEKKGPRRRNTPESISFKEKKEVEVDHGQKVQGKSQE